MEDLYLLFAKDRNGMLYDTHHARLTSDIIFYCTQCGSRIYYQNEIETDNFKQRHFFKHVMADEKDISICEVNYLNEAIKDIAHSILCSESSIFVSPIFTKGVIQAPDKIFAPHNVIISHDDLIGSQSVDFKWTSSKGKCMGLVFVDHNEVIENKMYDVNDSKAFIAEINLAILKSHLRSMIKSNHGVDAGLIKAIKKLLFNKNTHSRWISWDGKKSNLRISPAYFTTFNNYRYDSYKSVVSLEYLFHNENDYINNNTKSTLRLTGRKIDFQVKEIIYQFSLERGSCSDTFYVVIDEKECVLLDYVLNSVPVNDDTYNHIKKLCIKLIRIYESAMRGLSLA